ncbi:hypothetical protein SAMN04487818_11495 [Actinokineospora terrae]|uniref:Uncharacterized protein n=1 Tax=Actinokineospora terrae TaxID=155974 RepID=A0A1H9XD94_9PSEU|nr:hypothetical protein SAMN04487818_11495 [Actinokineospora terrae]
MVLTCPSRTLANHPALTDVGPNVPFYDVGPNTPSEALAEQRSSESLVPSWLDGADLFCVGERHP